MLFDLHMHSGYSSDGELSPRKLIELAKEKNIQVVALSDHDGVKGVREMMVEGEKEGIRVIPAIECSTLFGEYECHLLGYGIDIDFPYFQNLEEDVWKLLMDAFHERVVKLENKYPVKINEEEVIRDAKGDNPWFLMCERMFADPKNHHIEDFKDYIPGGKRSDPAPVNFFWDKCQAGSDLHVFVSMPDFKKSVEMIHQSGGIAILAHPFNTFYHREDLLEKAIEAGIDGLEVYSNYHDEEHILFYEEFARSHQLLITCGSDFHGKMKPSIKMGEYGLQGDGDEYLKAFLHKLENN